MRTAGGVLVASVMLVGGSARAATVPEGQLRVVGSVELEIGGQHWPLVRVAETGAIVALDREGSRVVAVSPEGTKLWEWSSGPSLGTHVAGLDLDGRGNLWLSSGRGEVAVLDGATGTPLSLGPPARLSKEDGSVNGIVAGSGGEYYLLTRAGRPAVRRFARADGPGAAFEVAPGAPPRPGADGPGWLGRGAEGSIYYCPRSDLAFYRYSGEGRLLETLRPADVPFQGRGAGNDPGDTLFGIGLLSGGRIVFEVAHRDPYQDGLGSDGQRIRRTSLDLRLYVVGPGGDLEAVLRPPWREIGQFVAVGPRDRLYFLTTAQLLKPGEAPRITWVELDRSGPQRAAR